VGWLLTPAEVARKVQKDLKSSKAKRAEPKTMSSLSLSKSVDVLSEVSTVLAGHHESLFQARSLLNVELEHVEKALKVVAAEGRQPASQASEHLVSSGGKRIRSMALLLSAACFGTIPKAALELAVVAEMIHAATLLHDDVIDDSDWRRGITTARKVYGNAVSVLAGDLLLTHALVKTSEAEPGLMTGLLVTLQRLVDGEILQLRGRTELDFSEQTYLQILEGKTASLFAWATHAGAFVAQAPSEQQQAMRSFGKHLGMAFQLVDDCLDFEGNVEQTGKAVLGDLQQGKITLPVALAIQEQPELKDRVLQARAGDRQALHVLHEAVISTQACAKVRQRADAAVQEACQALRPLDHSPARDLLRHVAVALTSRTA
jgi:octaprenyl-diphosphate synthase